MRPRPASSKPSAVEDESDDFTVWAAGTVVAVDYSVAADAEALVPQREWTGAAAVVPYRIELDISRVAVLVHKDEHWLVRDLALQAAGPRQAADGSRCLARLEKRQRVGGGWEVVDHATRHVRACEPRRWQLRSGGRVRSWKRSWRRRRRPQRCGAARRAAATRQYPSAARRSHIRRALDACAACKQVQRRTAAVSAS